MSRVDLKERMSILAASGTISFQIGCEMSDLVDHAKDRQHLGLTEENGAALLTHLAMAGERMAKGKTAAPLDAALLEEVKASSHCARAQEILKDWYQFLGWQLPEAESGYMLLHLCTLLEQEGNHND